MKTERAQVFETFFPKIINYKAKIDQTLSVKVCLVKNQK